MLHITIIVPGSLPVTLYGGTQRVAWDLGRALSRMGHRVCFLADRVDGTCSFAEVRRLDPTLSLAAQLPEGTELVHFQDHVVDGEKLRVPYVVTINGNTPSYPLDANSIFVSHNHAQRHGSESYVYNGLDWNELPPIDLMQPRRSYHFLGKAAWSVKNVRGAINVVCRLPDGRLTVLGGYRLNLKMGFRLTLSPRVRFYGMVDDATKYAVMQQSQGLIFPVTWHEPFGLAVIESLYAGCPVFATPYGDLPELVDDASLGFLTASASEMVDHLSNAPVYDPRHCHEYARETFSAEVMAKAYLTKYEQVLGGQVLNPSFGPTQSQYRDLPWRS